MIFIQKPFFIFLVFFRPVEAISQDPGMPVTYQSQQEALAEKKETDLLDDADELDLQVFRAHPLNLNSATTEDLIQLHLLQTVQINNFISYRKLLGSLLSIYELQGVPGWDLETIRMIIPYIRIGRDESLYSAIHERWTGGDNAIIVRAAQVLEKSKGYEKPADPDASRYEGSAQQIFIRYTYNYKNLLAFGFTGEKDAGEPFFRSAQRFGFDFYSFHFFLQHAGIVKALAIGDFTVNLGQGLIQWQSMAFTKSSQVMAIKREASCLRPYHSAGEYNFHRGFGISLLKGRWQSSFFIATQKISTNLEPDTAGREDLFSTFQHSGYHRTPAEIADRNNSRQFSAGGNIQYNGKRFMAGFNWMYFSFNRPFQKQDVPYNLYQLTGNRLSDYSLDYSYTQGNLHLFGEIALDQSKHPAWIQGALISLRENLNLSLLYRNISPAFQSLYSNAFTENSVPINESGLYAGLSCKPVAGMELSIYFDAFVFPWLKYRVDAPSSGRDLLLQWVFQPDKNFRFTTLYKNERKEINGLPVAGIATHVMDMPVKQRWRLETDYTISRSAAMTCRMEFVWINHKDSRANMGFLGMAGFNFHVSGISGNITAAMFETEGYDTRVYLYEPDLLYNFSLPAFYGSGLHYCLNIQKDFSRLIPHTGHYLKLSAGLKWEQTFYPGYMILGSGLDQISGSRKSEWKAQVLMQWRKVK